MIIDSETGATFWAVAEVVIATDVVATNPAAQGNGSGTMAADMFRVSGGKRVTDVPAFTSVPKITFKCQMSAANAAASFTRNATQTFLAAA